MKNKLSQMLPRLTAILALVYLTACGASGTRRYTYKIINTLPHDKGAYCQGLLFDGGFLYESTGRPDTSSLRKVELKTGKVLQQINLPGSLFAEGLALHKDRFYQITWESELGHVFDRDFKVIEQFKYKGEGWGLTSDGTHLIMSDGSATLTFRDPEQGFKTVRSLAVHRNKTPVEQLNELEYIDGEIWANVWKQDYLVRIDPKTGEVTGIVELNGLFPKANRVEEDAVLNGIAWDANKKRLFVTGKYWPNLFEIELQEIK